MLFVGMVSITSVTRRDRNGFVLPRTHLPSDDEESPAGWCGESAIQALCYACGYGHLDVLSRLLKRR